jgi:thiamine-phosphate pyrophosphorylase
VKLCLVTDRRRLRGRQTVPFEAARLSLIEQARSAIDAGVDLIQLRERDLEARDLAMLVADLVRLSRSTPTRVIVNDRLDVALAAGADGVHLRSDSIPAGAVRRIAPAGFLIGRSVHGVDEALAAGDVDYLVAGTVFRTVSKSDPQRVLGLDGLRAIVASVEVPVLAIGGVGLEQLGQIADTEAAGVAAIGLFLDALPLAPLVETIRRQFDRAKAAS